MAKGDRTKAAGTAALASSNTHLESGRAMAKKSGFKTIPAGTPVVWPYRGTHGHGRVVGIASKGTTNATTRYKVRQVDNHISSAGSHEKPIVIHTGKALSRTSGSVVQAAARTARQRVTGGSVKRRLKGH